MSSIYEFEWTKHQIFLGAFKLSDLQALQASSLRALCCEVQIMASNFSKNLLEPPASYWLKNLRIKLVTVQSLDSPYLSRTPWESRHPLTVQSNSSVQTLDALIPARVLVSSSFWTPCLVLIALCFSLLNDRGCPSLQSETKFVSQELIAAIA